MKSIAILTLYLCLHTISQAQNLIRGPYMTKATTQGVTLHWRTDVATKSKVRFGTSPGVYSGAALDNQIVIDHVIELSGLAADTKYFYTIGTNSTVLQGDSNNYFKTLPLSDPQYDKPLLFLAVGDIAKATIQEENVHNSFLKYLNRRRLDGYLMLGDNAYPDGEDTHFQHGFFNYFQQSITKNTVLWPTTGNHEYANDYTRRKTHDIAYFDIFTLPTQGESGGLASNTELYYSFNVGNIHFINLDSYGLENVGANYYSFTDTVLSPQVNWLKNDLASNTLPWVIVSFHHPPYCMGTHNSDVEPDLVAIREKLNPIFERYNVDLVLNGHCHSYQRSMFINKHYGMENTFDTLAHRIQNGGGNDIMNECPYIKNSTPPVAADSGLLYLVIGSGSAAPQWPQSSWPHNAMYYSNYADNGALLLTVEGNKLTGEWISTDTLNIVKDKFIMYKNVNRKHHIISDNQPITLTASWSTEEAYNWSTGDTTKTIIIQTDSNETISVRDFSGCLHDSFYIQYAPTAVGKQEKNEIRISPNPVNDKLIIDGLDVGNYLLAIIDQSGKNSVRKNFNLRQKNTPYQLSTDRLANGKYILQLSNNNKLIGAFNIMVTH